MPMSSMLFVTIAMRTPLTLTTDNTSDIDTVILR